MEVPTNEESGELGKQAWKLRHKPSSTHHSLFPPSDVEPGPGEEGTEKANICPKLKFLSIKL